MLWRTPRTSRLALLAGGGLEDGSSNGGGGLHHALLLPLLAGCTAHFWKVRSRCVTRRRRALCKLHRTHAASVPPTTPPHPRIGRKLPSSRGSGCVSAAVDGSGCHMRQCALLWPEACSCQRRCECWVARPPHCLSRAPPSLVTAACLGSTLHPSSCARQIACMSWLDR